MKNFILRIKSRLTSRQLELLTTLLCFLFFSIFLLVNLISGNNKSNNLAIITTICFTACISIYIIIFLVNSCISKTKKGKTNFTNTLVISEKYREFEYIPSIEDKEKNMILKILKQEDCRFYAKLTESQSINLIVIDRYENTIFTDNINDYSYFYSIFKNIE